MRKMSPDKVNNDRTFKEITDAVVYDEANGLVERQKDRLRQWIELERVRGNEPSLNDVIKKLMAEPGQRRHIIASLSACLWREIERDRDSE